jgi:hypothetical protein
MGTRGSAGRLKEIAQLLRELRDVSAEVGGDVSGLDEIVSEFQKLDERFEPEYYQRRYLDLLFERVKSMGSDPKTLEETRKAALALDPARQREALFIVRFGLSDDSYGVVIRGHVIVEDALGACIASYLPDRPALGKDFPRFRRGFMGKVILGYDLGVFDAAERQILKEFNALRNRVAHELGGDEEPRFGIRLEG